MAKSLMALLEPFVGVVNLNEIIENNKIAGKELINTLISILKAGYAGINFLRPLNALVKLGKFWKEEVYSTLMGLLKKDQCYHSKNIINALAELRDIDNLLELAFNSNKEKEENCSAVEHALIDLIPVQEITHPLINRLNLDRKSIFENLTINKILNKLAKNSPEIIQYLIGILENEMQSNLKSSTWYITDILMETSNPTKEVIDILLKFSYKENSCHLSPNGSSDDFINFYKNSEEAFDFLSVSSKSKFFLNSEEAFDLSLKSLISENFEIQKLASEGIIRAITVKNLKTSKYMIDSLIMMLGDKNQNNRIIKQLLQELPSHFFYRQGILLR